MASERSSKRVEKPSKRVEKPSKRTTATVQFHYIKGPNYHEVMCDGAIGGLTPQGLLWLGLYAERGPLPRVVEYEVEAEEGATSVELNETATKPTRVETRHGIVRHVEVSAYLNMDAAVRLHKWLGKRIAEHKKKTKEKEPGGQVKK